MIAKCGPRVIHHWAHSGRRNCDPWWENETPWHRAWKDLFPPECRELCHTAPDGEVHRSDIRTQSGIYIEVQHSAMSDAERLAREAFYGNLIWVIDGAPFKANFNVLHELPDPRSELAQDLVFTRGGSFSRLSEHHRIPGVSKATFRGARGAKVIHVIGNPVWQKIADQVLGAYCGHHLYNWMRPRQTWLDAKCPVFIDFKDYLLKMEVYDETGLPCVCIVNKRAFVESAMHETDARAVLTSAAARPKPDDGYLRETFTLPREKGVYSSIGALGQLAQVGRFVQIG
jgi:hypothetical protein